MVLVGGVDVARREGEWGIGRTCARRHGEGGLHYYYTCAGPKLKPMLLYPVEDKGNVSDIVSRSEGCDVGRDGEGWIGSQRIETRGP